MASRVFSMASAVAVLAESAISVEKGRSLAPIAASATPRATAAASSFSWTINRTKSEPRLRLDFVRGRTTVVLRINTEGSPGAGALRTRGTIGHVFQTASFDLDTPDTRI